MEKELDEIKDLWKKAKDTNKDRASINIVNLIALGEAKKKSTLLAHYGNALVLTATVAILVFYFYYLYNFQDLISNIGINVMIGGLTLRIAIEIFSAIRSRRIHISDTAAQSIQNSVSFYNFRKRIHGPVTIIIFVAYVIGFYLLTPEFSRHLDLTWVILMDVSALIIFIVLAFVIRKGIRQEFKDLEKIVELQTALTKEN